jgi:hypothetical protein
VHHRLRWRLLNEHRLLLRLRRRRLLREHRFLLLLRRRLLRGNGRRRRLLLRLRDVVERLDEPVALRLGLKEAGRLRRRQGRLDGEEEDPQPERGSAVGAAAGARRGAEQVEAVVLEDEVLQILVVGDGDERVQVLPGQLVLDADVPKVSGERGEARGEVGEAERPLERQDLGLAVDVRELVVVQETGQLSPTGLSPSMASVPTGLRLTAGFVTPRQPGRAGRTIPRHRVHNGRRLGMHTV